MSGASVVETKDEERVSQTVAPATSQRLAGMPPPRPSSRLALAAPGPRREWLTTSPLHHLRALIETFPRGHGYDEDPYSSSMIVASHRMGAVIHPTTEELRFYVAAKRKFLDTVALDQAGRGQRAFIAVGSGLETRAFRLPLPRQLVWVEIDAPGVLAFKEFVLSEVGAHPMSRRHIVATMEVDAWRGHLAQVGVRLRDSAVWLMDSIPLTGESGVIDPLWRYVVEESAPWSVVTGFSGLGCERTKEIAVELMGDEDAVTVTSLESLGSRLGRDVPAGLPGCFVQLRKLDVIDLTTYDAVGGAAE